MLEYASGPSTFQDSRAWDICTKHIPHQRLSKRFTVSRGAAEGQLSAWHAISRNQLTPNMQAERVGGLVGLGFGLVSVTPAAARRCTATTQPPAHRAASSILLARPRRRCSDDTHTMRTPNTGEGVRRTPACCCCAGDASPLLLLPAFCCCCCCGCFCCLCDASVLHRERPTRGAGSSTASAITRCCGVTYRNACGHIGAQQRGRQEQCRARRWVLGGDTAGRVWGVCVCVQSWKDQDVCWR